jgi:hypothetical protein
MTYCLNLIGHLRDLGMNPSLLSPGRLEAWAVRMRFYNMTPEEAAAGFITYMRRKESLPNNGGDPQAHMESTVVQWDSQRKLDLDRLKQVMTWID